MKNIPFYLVLLFSSITQISTAQNQLPAGLKKIAGSWIGVNGQEKIIENWMYVNPHMMYGSAATINAKGDTIPAEALKISVIRGMVFYIPTIRVEKKIKSTPFKLEKEEETYWRFENNAHDFPKVIEYRLTDNDHLKASISGPDSSGVTKTIDFNYERFKK